jgi:hypothetical protein
VSTPSPAARRIAKKRNAAATRLHRALRQIRTSPSTEQGTDVKRHGADQCGHNLCNNNKRHTHKAMITMHSNTRTMHSPLPAKRHRSEPVRLVARVVSGKARPDVKRHRASKKAAYNHSSSQAYKVITHVKYVRLAAAVVSGNARPDVKRHRASKKAAHKHSSNQVDSYKVITYVKYSYSHCIGAARGGRLTSGGRGGPGRYRTEAPRTKQQCGDRKT